MENEQYYEAMMQHERWQDFMEDEAERIAENENAEYYPEDEEDFDPNVD